ncbi:ABC transporter permease [Streptomyces sp. NPDC046900]|uniref:ABC transporter permease n=1 Tax=Streptomyces sp. NPDC046900 TaxID=3155473 RepID=UPI0033E63F84
MASAATAPRTDRAGTLDTIIRRPIVGPLAALLIACAVFTLITDNFLAIGNLSLILQQCIVVGMLAVGQTLVVLTAGIDLSVGAIAVLGTIVLAKLAGHGAPLALLLTLVLCAALGGLNGTLVTVLRLPPFIVTLGSFTVLAAVTQLYAGSSTYPVQSQLLTATGTSVHLGGVSLTYGILLMLALYATAWYALTQTAWGKHVYAVGDNVEAARLTGIKVSRNLLSVYIATGIVCGLAAWAALGRIPNADPNAYQNANLESITAVVIGGTSLFGGRGGVGGTLLGTLIVGVLRNGLTLAGIDNLYQNVATGILVILAVAVDQFARRRNK